MTRWEEARAAVARIYDGEIRCSSYEETDETWCRIVARGRIVATHRDGTRGPYAVSVAVAEGPGGPYGIFYNASSARAYRCSPEDAAAAIQDPSVFNLT